MNGNRNGLIIFCCWIFSGLAIGSSFLYESFYHQEPCKLCNFQRIALLGVFIGSSLWKFQTMKFFCLFLMKISLLNCFVLASLHFAVQMDWIHDFCSVPNIKTIDQFAQLLENSSGCSKISWKIFGVPVSAFNATISAIFLLIVSNSKHRDHTRPVSNFSIT